MKNVTIYENNGITTIHLKHKKGTVTLQTTASASAVKSALRGVGAGMDRSAAVEARKTAIKLI